MAKTETTKSPAYTCRLCGAATKLNRFGDAVDQRWAPDHPYLVIRGYRICVPSYKGILRLEIVAAFNPGGMDAIIIERTSRLDAPKTLLQRSEEGTLAS